MPEMMHTVSMNKNEHTIHIFLIQASSTFTLRLQCFDIHAGLSFQSMLSQHEIIEKPVTCKSGKTVQIRQKIKEVFGWDCAMKDDLLLQGYTLTSNGELIVIVK